jgi:RNA polymerase subunit RPABC4/transcription elongation factor Spt4
MKKKECPSCAMEIDADSRICPICGYEFPGTKMGYKWIAILLVILILFFMIFRIF